MKITVHPLFIVLGIASALFGGLPIFVIYALTALLHECGHIFYASKIGIECNKISLMPYGAAAMCSTEGISPIDEIKLAIAGPAVNAFMCVFCAGLWWFYPQTYPYTEIIFEASKVMLIINLLPAYPLDGGRVVRCILALFVSSKTATLILRVLSFVLSAILIALFFAYQKNISFLIFSTFLFVSAFEKNTQFLQIAYMSKTPKRGKEIKEVMLTPLSTYKDAIRYLDSSKYIIFKFYTDALIDEIYQDELITQLKTHTIYDRILDP